MKNRGIANSLIRDPFINCVNLLLFDLQSIKLCGIKVKESKTRLLGGRNRLWLRKCMNEEALTIDDILLIVPSTKAISHY